MLANTVIHRSARPETLTVCVTGAVMAAAPTADAPPVFVDDSGTRRKLIRFTGLIVMLVLVGFLGLVGMALAVPSVGATVGLGDATPFQVPGAAAKPPPPAPVAKKRVQTDAPVKHQDVVPAPRTEAPVVTAPPAENPPVVDLQGVDQPIVVHLPGVDQPIVVQLPVVDLPAEKPAEQNG